MTAAPDLLSRTTGRGVVGDRQLVGVQCFDIARLTTHAVPLVPGTFVAVSGVGPKADSNGSGKTSFLAAVSVLLGDPQWRMDTNGGRLAAGLLFRPDSAGVDGAMYAPAATGHIVGVFAHPDDIPGTALTVWIRLSGGSPSLEAKWAHGLHVAGGDTERDRYDQSAEIWQSLPASSRLSARRLREELYGQAPRCMTYLDTPLRPAVPSLLSQQMTEMSPERIGESLIELCGLRQRLEDEESQRGELAEHQRRLAGAVDDDERRTREEDGELEGVRARARAREALGRGALMWRLHFARRYLEVVDEHAVADQARVDAQEQKEKARAAADTARQAAAELRGRTDLKADADAARVPWDRAREAAEENRQAQAVLGSQRSALTAGRTALASAADGWSGVPAADAAGLLETARGDHSDTKAAVGLAGQTVERAEQDLTRARAGRDGLAGRALDALAAVGIDSVGLTDAIGLDPAARAEWEPRLAPWRGAVVVAHHHAHDAYVAMADAGLFGAQVVAEDPPGTGAAMPAGMTCARPIGAFAAGLAAATTRHAGPDRVDWHGLGLVVLGGFPAPFTGRQARIAAAEQVLADAIADRDAAVRRVEQARARLDAAAGEHARAVAAERLAADDAEAGRLGARLGELRAALAPLAAAEAEAEQAWSAANALAVGHASQVEAAESHARLLAQHVDAAVGRTAAARKAVDGLHLPYWRAGWGGTADEAAALLAEQDEKVARLTPKRLRNRAQEALTEALAAYTQGVTEIPADVAEVEAHKDELADGDDQAGSGQDFDSLSRPLRLRLEGALERDEIVETQIARERALRAATVGELNTEVGQRAGVIEALQDMIERLVEDQFRRISDAFGRLDTSRGMYGGDLQVTSVRPDSATATWRWQVVPRWRRAPGGPLVSYKMTANGAQVKVYAVQVVLAALLAAEGATGRVLVLDELGNSLGEVNRKDVLAALKKVASEQRITILGTCQDSVLYDAADACGEILWFTHADASDAYNQPTRAWAHDPVAGRVELTADWITAGRSRA